MARLQPRTAWLPQNNMRFLVDAQLPPALARWLAAKGHEAMHVADIGLQGGSDTAIWTWASEQGAVIISKDDDFVRLAHGGAGPAVLWVTTGNVGKQVLLAAFERSLPEVISALQDGERIVELR